MTFDQQLKLDAREMVKQWGESVTYQPYGGEDKVIQAIVNRDKPRRVPEASQGLIKDIEVCILNDATNGVTSIKPAKDKITLSTRYGEEPTERVVTAILSGDAGLWTLQVG
jgi:hypothetical protein